MEASGYSDNYISDLLERVIDEKIEKAISNKISKIYQTQAEVIRQDDQGMYWVKLPGQQETTPVISATSEMRIGDQVSLEIRNGRTYVTGNVSSPSPTMATAQEYVQRVVDPVAETVKNLSLETADIQVLKAQVANIDTAHIEELFANKADINLANVRNLLAGTIDTGQIDTDKIEAALANLDEILSRSAWIDQVFAKNITVNELDANKADIDFANVLELSANGVHTHQAAIDDLFAASAWLNKLEVTGDAEITGQLVSVLIDGDTARFRNIFADAVNVLGPDGAYHALNLAGLSDEQLADIMKATVMSMNGFSEAEYEALTEEQRSTYEDAATTTLDEGLHGRHIIAESITADKIDATSVRAALLEVLNLVIGWRQGFHIEMETDARGGSINFVNGEKSVPDQPWTYVNENGTDNQASRIAYIQADDTGDSIFYMNKAIVMTDLRFAKWQWKARSNGNLTLKWIG